MSSIKRFTTKLISDQVFERNSSNRRALGSNGLPIQGFVGRDGKPVSKEVARVMNTFQEAFDKLDAKVDQDRQSYMVDRGVQEGALKKATLQDLAKDMGHTEPTFWGANKIRKASLSTMLTDMGAFEQLDKDFTQARQELDVGDDAEQLRRIARAKAEAAAKKK